MHEHRERKQPFSVYRKVNLNRIKSRLIHFNKLYLQPIGEFNPSNSPRLEILQQFCEAFFNLEVEVLPTLVTTSDHQYFRYYGHGKGEAKYQITCRENPSTKNVQLLTGSIHHLCKKVNRKLNGYCVVAVTMDDLYPSGSWNFVFGEADPEAFTGVFSFARYSPAFPEPVDKLTEDQYRLLVWRSCGVMVHEIGHLFDLEHCQYYQCVMNGSNHLQESDSQPLHDCPVCLHKLCSAIGFDPTERYTKLYEFYRRYAYLFPDEYNWMKERIANVKTETISSSSS
eukprot:TRINITY_DN3167_c0_g1_i1.p1 TRINITY_DN3167_c0_g1~~TRINITY_DN3167_c0_g1_i1.p1  ORF type:complete len:283 (-),score=20.05 TRINITY_DN3167_c0_g1_i1:108-956(-)